MDQGQRQWQLANKKLEFLLSGEFCCIQSAARTNNSKLSFTT